MYPFSSSPATLLHLNRTVSSEGLPRDEFIPMTSRRCSMRVTRADTAARGVVVAKPACRCAIPSGEPVPGLGDVLLPGALDLPSPLKPSEAAELLTNTPDAFRVTRVEDRTGPGWPLPHVVAEGE